MLGAIDICKDQLSHHTKDQSHAKEQALTLDTNEPSNCHCDKREREEDNFVDANGSQRMSAGSTALVFLIAVRM